MIFVPATGSDAAAAGCAALVLDWLFHHHSATHRDLLQLCGWQPPEVEFDIPNNIDFTHTVVAMVRCSMFFFSASEVAGGRRRRAKKNSWRTSK